MAQKANDEEKIYSLKTVQTEISRLQKSMDKKREKIENLTAELKADKSHMKELEKLADELQENGVEIIEINTRKSIGEDFAFGAPALAMKIYRKVLTNVYGAFLSGMATVRTQHLQVTQS